MTARRYIITTHKRLPGARLSLSGQWGNQPHPDIETAERAARADAGGAAISIERERF